MYKFVSESLSSVKNQYDTDHAERYAKTTDVAYKKYGAIPMAIAALTPEPGKVYYDLGCGTLPYTNALADTGAKEVIGVDLADAMVSLAQSINTRDNITIQQGNVFKFQYAPCDGICAPHVINYTDSKADVTHLISLWSEALNPGGKVFIIVDSVLRPCGKVEWGATIDASEPHEDGAELIVKVHGDDGSIVDVSNYSWSPETICAILDAQGFINVSERAPWITKEGHQTQGPHFWDNYPSESNLRYITAEKPWDIQDITINTL